MPITHFEKFASRGGTLTRRRIDWIVQGTESDAEVLTYALIYSSPFHNGLIRQPADIALKYIGPSLWDISIPYLAPDDPDNDEDDEEEQEFPPYEFDTTGGTHHITHSRGTKIYGREDGKGGPAPNFQGAINVKGDDVAGVDVIIPQLKFSVPRTVPRATVTNAYIGTLTELTGTFNNADFKGGKRGEILFLGAAGGVQGTGDYKIKFDFAYSKNLKNQMVGPIGPFDVDGWEYMWVHYVPAEDEDAGRITPMPHAVYVEEIYEAGDFDDLGIGS